MHAYSSQAIKANPKHTKAFFRRAQAMESLGEVEQAKQSLIQAAELAPQDTKIREFFHPRIGLRLSYMLLVHSMRLLLSVI